MIGSRLAHKHQGRETVTVLVGKAKLAMKEKERTRECVYERKTPTTVIGSLTQTSRTGSERAQERQRARESLTLYYDDYFKYNT